MRAVVVYESMYGNTHLVADAIGAGLRDSAGADVEVVAVGDAGAALLAGADLVVVGGPTHAHGMSREATRKSAVEGAAKPESDLELDPDAEGPGLREWFDALEPMSADAAAFDTRFEGPAVFMGRASKGIAKRLRAHGCDVVVEPQSFLVDRKNQHLLEDEVEHARAWGAAVAAAVAERSQPPAGDRAE